MNNLNFDQSERFDDSMMSRDGLPDQLGRGLDSQDNSMDLSAARRKRKLKKQKEDLDGSRVYRDSDQLMNEEIIVQAPSKPIRKMGKLI